MKLCQLAMNLRGSVLWTKVRRSNTKIKSNNLANIWGIPIAFNSPLGYYISTSWLSKITTSSTFAQACTATAHGLLSLGLPWSTSDQVALRLLMLCLRLRSRFQDPFHVKFPIQTKGLFHWRGRPNPEAVPVNWLAKSTGFPNQHNCPNQQVNRINPMIIRISQFLAPMHTPSLTQPVMTNNKLCRRVKLKLG